MECPKRESYGYKHKFPSECIESDTIPKGPTPNVPLNVKDAPEELKTEFSG